MRVVRTLTTLAVLGGVCLCSALGPPHGSAALADAALRGIARSAAGPVASAEVAAGIIGWAPAAGDHVAVTRTDAEGRFALEQAPLGPIDVWVRPEGGKWTFAIRMWHPGVNDLEIDARPKESFSGFGRDSGGETLSGVVKGKGGKAVASAAVGLRGDDDTWVLTDDEGRFTLEGAKDGDGLVVRHDGYRDEVGEVKLGKKRMTIKLAPAKPTVVRVTDSGGAALPGAWVTLGDPDRVQSTTGFSSMFPPRARLVGGWTDEAGEAHVVWGHTESKTVATAYAAGHAPARKAITAAKGVVVLRVAPTRPARATVVLRGSGEPLAGVYVGLPHESDGGPDAISALPADAERGPIIVGRSGENGQCVVPHLAEDVETLRIVGEHKLRAEVRLERITGD